MRTCAVFLGALAVCLLISCCSAAAGGPCDASCNDKLNCCADQNLGRMCFNTTTHDCTANKQICAKGLSLCDKTCYDGGMYDCIGTKLCPEGFQLCGVDQCFNTSVYSCISGTQKLRLKTAAECGGLGYNTKSNECVNSTTGPTRTSTDCAPHQSLCGTYCYDPELYACGASGTLNPLPGFCGQGEVWCGTQCYIPTKYICQGGVLVGWKVGDPCPTGQQLCGQVCYNPSANLVCSEDHVICPSGLGVCNSTCYNTTRYDCMMSEIVMHDGYCPTGLGLCGTRCFNRTAYECNRDLLTPIGVAGCGGSPCFSSDKCCSDAYNGTLCYEDMYYECVSNPAGAKLCGKGFQLCNSDCYDPSIYSCFDNNVLCPTGLDYCGSNSTAGCYDKTIHQCLSSSVLCPIDGRQCDGACINIDRYVCNTGDQIEYVVCPRGQLNCAGTCYVAGGKISCVNHTLVTNDQVVCTDGTCNGSCYDTSRQICDNGVIVPKPQCSDDDDLCYDTCYDPDHFMCDGNTVYIMCPTGQDRCGNYTCYDESTQNCVNGKVVNETCTSKGLMDCGSGCYNASTQGCKDGAAYTLCSASGQGDCAGVCYNTTTYQCSSGQVVIVCTGSNSQNCGSKYCYNPSTHHCKDGNVIENSAHIISFSAPLLIFLLISMLF